ncbi:LysR family transcriptional regulator [Sorangium sp. KYC3313]|uniref:LysR family transcriptional regulator n=1 Tax=Sorangium sp. KYC3313 TaxID=3449740 RepID=UPI003F8CAD17
MYLMPGMSEIDVRSINLNLLPALEALLVEGSVSAAARRAHISQSAMSHSLARLRELFGDPLLVPLGCGLTPTPRALQLRAALPAAFEHLRRALASPEPFDPRTSARTFRVATVDYFELTTLPDVLDHLGEHAPFVRLEIERFSPDVTPALVLGDIDLALFGASQPVPAAGLRRAPLYQDPSQPSHIDSIPHKISKIRQISRPACPESRRIVRQSILQDPLHPPHTIQCVCCQVVCVRRTAGLRHQQPGDSSSFSSRIRQLYRDVNRNAQCRLDSGPCRRGHRYSATT